MDISIYFYFSVGGGGGGGGTKSPQSFLLLSPLSGCDCITVELIRIDRSYFAELSAQACILISTLRRLQTLSS